MWNVEKILKGLTQEEQQSERESAKQDRQYTSHNPKKAKATSSIFPSKFIKMLERIL